jgi:DNA-binding helix-hairpin-helix protein with protein kinase domain
MARILRWMHNRGLCHSDLSPKNFLINIKNGQTALIDCDGLVVPGIQPASVFGTPWCMAPEIEMGSAMPSVNTDKHALAVLMYWTFLLRHPLVGPKIHHRDPEQDEALAKGANALYIEHPTDHSNRPVPLPFTSEMLTPLVCDLFRRAFVDALHKPEKRPAAAEWESALVRMADRIVPCQKPDCMMHAFVAPDTNNFKCPWCGTPYRAGLLPVAHLYRPGARRGVYDSDKWSMVALQNRPILQHHVDSRKSPDPGVSSVPSAHFEMSSGGKWYLKNDGLDDATILETSGATPFKRGTSLELQPGMRILFGREEHCRVAFFQMLQTT